jgi:hypothetical protein
MTASLLVLAVGLLAAPLTRSNVSVFDGQTAIPVDVQFVSGQTKITIGLPTFPVTNAFLGFDHFLYGAENPIVRVQDEGCDEPVVDGTACGWRVNFDGCNGDGFGCFASHSSQDPAGHGDRTAPLVFFLAGEATLTPNDRGAVFALHGRFEDCSGWFSDGIAAVSPEPACIARPPQPPLRACSLQVEPSSLSLVQGGAASAVVTVAETGDAPFPPLTLSILPSPLPAGLALVLAPNPTTGPGDLSLSVQASSSAPAGAAAVTVRANGTDPSSGQAIQCEVQLALEVTSRPPAQCICP